MPLLTPKRNILEFLSIFSIVKALPTLQNDRINEQRRQKKMDGARLCFAMSQRNEFKL